jgi:deoxyribodipyrimidine photo-lyase
VCSLKRALQSRGLDLKLFFAKPSDVFASLLTLGFDEVAASGDYDAYARERDIGISHLIDFNYLHDTYVFRPDELLKPDNTPYLMFTPFYRRAKAVLDKEHMKRYPFAPQQLISASFEGIIRLHSGAEERLPLAISSIGFKENMPDLASAEEKLRRLAGRLKSYAHEREYPALDATSGLSVDLRFGTISVRRLLRFLQEQKAAGVETEPFFRQLVFRDFYASLLYHFPRLQTENYRYGFTGVGDTLRHEAFMQGRTGVPIVDAGVKELLETGRMHNRIRMICASFYTKDLLLPWQWGEAFFARHLLDYDAASNILSWQWSAGTGIDPQPYFRIFNPYLQSKKFDREADYIKRWLPQLQDVPAKLLHDENYLLTHGIKGYPPPMVHHKEAAREALACFKRQKDASVSKMVEKAYL